MTLSNECAYVHVYVKYNNWELKSVFENDQKKKKSLLYDRKITMNGLLVVGVTL